MSLEDERTRQLERVLAEEPVVAVIHAGIQPGTRNSSALETVELAGGVKALFKRGDVPPMTPLAVWREVAAFEVAKLLGVSHLLPVTALRRIPTAAGGAAVDVAAAELFLDRKEGLPVDTFAIEDIENAGVFDAIVANSDRSGHNWFAVPSKEGEQLKLCDHELAFGSPGNVSSSFWDHIGRIVPARLRTAVGRLDNSLAESAVANLLPPEEISALAQRVADLRRTY